VSVPNGEIAQELCKMDGGIWLGRRGVCDTDAGGARAEFLCAPTQRHWHRWMPGGGGGGGGVHEDWLREPHCLFRVLRRRRRERVFACSFWLARRDVARSDYAVTLINALYWWATAFPRIVAASAWGAGSWNVRLYVDAALPLQRPIGTDDGGEQTWGDLLEWMLRHEHIELYLYDCPIGYAERTAHGSSHVNTFGSLLRLHALTDPTLSLAAIRNVEALTSVEDLNLVRRWFSRMETTTPPVERPWVLSPYHTRASQHSEARHYVRKHDGDHRLAARGEGFCLCSLTVAGRLFASWNDILALAQEWNTRLDTPRTRHVSPGDWYPLLDIGDRQDYAYGVDEFVTDIVVYRLGLRRPLAVTIVLGNHEPALYFQEQSRQVDDAAWRRFLQSWARSALRDPFYRGLARDLPRVWRNLEQAAANPDFDTDPWRDSWIQASYTFAADAQRFLYNSALPPPLPGPERAWVDASLARQLDQNAALVFGSNHHRSGATEAEAEALLPDMGIPPERRRQLGFWVDRDAIISTAFALPGWSLKASNRRLTSFGRIKKYWLRRDLLRAQYRTTTPRPPSSLRPITPVLPSSGRPTATRVSNSANASASSSPSLARRPTAARSLPSAAAASSPPAATLTSRSMFSASYSSPRAKPRARSLT
jgi:hypothetical protein